MWSRPVAPSPGRSPASARGAAASAASSSTSTPPRVVPSLDSLLASADVLVHNFGPSRARELALDDDTLARDPPGPDRLFRAVVAGQPRRRRPARRRAARDGTARCATTSRWATATGRSSSAFPIGSWASVYLAASGIMARLVARGRTGHAGPVHTSLIQGALVPMAMHWRRADTPITGRSRSGCRRTTPGHPVRVRRRRVDPPHGQPRCSRR